MKRKFSLFLPIMFIVIAGLIGCSSDSTSTDTEDSIQIYTTIFPLEDFTKKIGGDHVSVKSVYPPSADAHTYEPSTKQMVELAEADLFIYTGIGLEGFAEKAHETLEAENVPILKAGEGISLQKSTHDHEHEGEHAEENAHDHEHGEEDKDDHAHDVDPHIWLDPILAEQLAENIKNKLVELKPEAAEEFENNFKELQNQFHDLDTEMKEVIHQAEQKEIVVSHAAYGYWEKRYGLKQISISGLSPTEEPSQKELANIIELAKEHNIQYVIFEQNVSNKVADIVQRELHAKTLTFHNLESITEEQYNSGEDYFSLMNENIETLRTALEAK
ncbi:zinc ABC transporter substrate-binding protein [Bacillus sp. FJAT-47783]|uniref:metal ABC transporter solute-binding protein, Zn/Mn family n=1 Tax=Bacillus sp. FJAT-47783 TaxID=2922712 RepID=UPI001FAE2C3D|nr:zinc ABC transporter substrate-binding protein [Bacillus sp. FJAT-47783]